MPDTVFHPLKPIYNKNSKILFLGTMPSPASRRAAFYYAHPQNRFWRVLCEVIEEELPQTNEEKTALLLRRNIALWDTLAACTIDGAADASIKNAQPNDLKRIFAAAQIQAVFTTGKKAGELYKKHSAQKHSVPYFVLPSTSGANCAVSYDTLVCEYKKILPYLKS